MFFDDLNELTATEMTVDSSEESEEDDVFINEFGR